MRLIDADELLKELDSFSMRIGGSANAMALSVMHETKKSIAKMIDEQATAYDVDKVVERLEAEKYKDGGTSGFCDYDEGVNDMCDVAMEIIKAGGVG